MSKIKTRCSFNSKDFEIICDIAKQMSISVEDYVFAATISMTKQILAETRKLQEEQANGKASAAKYSEYVPIPDVQTGTPGDSGVHPE